MSGRKNILFVVMDQFRADCVSGALADHVQLPNLQALRAEAVTFRNHYSVCNPCGPSRASILTGRYAMNHSAVRNGTPLPHDMPNLALEARKAGYDPMLFGYTDITRDPREHDPNDPLVHSYEQVLPGFREVLEMRLEESWPWRAHLKSKGYGDLPPYPDIFHPQGDDPTDPALYSAEDSDTAFLTDMVLHDLSVRPPGWFAHVTYIRPHPPLVAPAPYNKMYDPTQLPAPTVADGVAVQTHPFLDAAIRYKPASSLVEGLPDLPDTAETAAKLRAVYFGLATEVDHHIGRLISFLKDTGQYDNTLLVVTADHGEMLGDHGSWGKMTYFDAAYHTPLIIRDPNNPGQYGTDVDLPTESIDVTPTMLDLCGLTPPDTMDGHSLRPFLEGKMPQTWRRFTYSELDFGDPITATFQQRHLGLDVDQANLAILRSDTHTLVHFNGGLPPVLFDHAGEGELRDVSGQPGADKTMLRMAQAMLDHRMSNPSGRFAHTLITEAGVLNTPRHNGSGLTTPGHAKAS